MFHLKRFTKYFSLEHFIITFSHKLINTIHLSSLALAHAENQNLQHTLVILETGGTMWVPSSTSCIYYKTSHLQTCSGMNTHNIAVF